MRTKGDFQSWIAFYLEGICGSAINAYQRAKEIEYLEENIRHRIKYDAFHKVREASNAILDYLFTHPITGVTELSRSLGKAYNTISGRLQYCSALSIVSHHSVNEKTKLYRVSPYLDLLEEEF